jgi:hypothetical protein
MLNPDLHSIAGPKPVFSDRDAHGFLIDFGRLNPDPGVGPDPDPRIHASD